MNRRGLAFFRGALLCCGLVCAPSEDAIAQEPRIRIAITGELAATPLSRAVAQRVGELVQRAHADLDVVLSDTVSRMLDGIAYIAPSPLVAYELHEVCRQFRASAIVDILAYPQRRGLYRGVAVRIVTLHRPSPSVGTEIALLPVAVMSSSTTDSLALELAPRVAKSLNDPLNDRSVATSRRLRCLDYSETGELASGAPRSRSNASCC
jgi:hypothetical protein